MDTGPQNLVGTRGCRVTQLLFGESGLHVMSFPSWHSARLTFSSSILDSESAADRISDAVPPTAGGAVQSADEKQEAGAGLPGPRAPVSHGR